ncbi:MAG: hypothetical protein LC753_04350 [Acidobacteria bacterium]|nr:hypothetical protein [Acidobacteriota bacterium]MCA1649530.1 hypothetical protein [Acidobacteriota bacterium]
MDDLNAILTCPHCSHEEPTIMPTDRCVIVFDCPGCGATLRPKAGDCCVFCSYADRSCPPTQASPGADCDGHAR